MIVRLFVVLCTLTVSIFAIDTPGKVPTGAKVYVQPMDGFGTYVIAAINKKKVPVKVVADREGADFEIGGNAESQKAGWAKIIFAGSVQSHEEASINVTNLKTNEIVFAYNVNKGNAARGKQSAAEACAKHLKEVVGK
ncbi:MAG: hypothetical protein M3O20_06120 [Acidobacteriota bacterium]|nr:hypothetical protein [Acidobacteriota bacterium]